MGSPRLQSGAKHDGPALDTGMLRAPNDAISDGKVM